MGSALYQFLAVLTGKFDCNLFSSNQLIILNTITSIGNLGTLTYRISVGWMAIALILYNSDKSPLPSGRMEMSYLSWVSSMLGIGGVVGTIAAGLMADRFGRKYTLLAAAIPQIVSESKNIVVVFFCLIQMFSKRFFIQISYLLIIYAQNVYFLLVSRFLSGYIGGVMFVVIPLMVAEIAEDR